MPLASPDGELGLRGAPATTSGGGLARAGEYPGGGSAPRAGGPGEPGVAVVGRGLAAGFALSPRSDLPGSPGDQMPAWCPSSRVMQLQGPPPG